MTISYANCFALFGMLLWDMRCVVASLNKIYDTVMSAISVFSACVESKIFEKYSLPREQDVNQDDSRLRFATCLGQLPS